MQNTQNKLLIASHSNIFSIRTDGNNFRAFVTRLLLLWKNWNWNFNCMRLHLFIAVVIIIITYADKLVLFILNSKLLFFFFGYDIRILTRVSRLTRIFYIMKRARWKSFPNMAFQALLWKTVSRCKCKNPIIFNGMLSWMGTLITCWQQQTINPFSRK